MKKLALVGLLSLFTLGCGPFEDTRPNTRIDKGEGCQYNSICTVRVSETVTCYVYRDGISCLAGVERD